MENNYLQEMEDRTANINRVINSMNVVIEGSVLERRRTRDLSDARFICYKVLYGLGIPLNVIAKSFGRNHSTVIHGIKEFENSHKMSHQFRVLYNNFMRVYKSSAELSSNPEDHLLNKLSYYEELVSTDHFKKILSLSEKIYENKLLKNKFKYFCEENGLEILK
jgi:hypothetical protein